MSLATCQSLPSISSPNVAVYSVFTSPNHPPVPNHLPTLIVTPVNNPQHVLYSYIHTSFNRETYLLTPSPQGDLCVAKMVPPPGSRGPGGRGSSSDSSHSSDSNRDKTVRCEASRNLKWSITNTGIAAPVYKLTLPNPDAPGTEQPLFQISKPNPHATFWTMFYFTYAGHGIPPKRIEFGKIQKNASTSSGGGGTRVAITGKTPEEKAVWQTLGEGNEDMVEWIVLCAGLNLLDEEIIKAAEKASGGGSRLRDDARAVPSSRPGAGSGIPPIQIRPTQGNAPQPFANGTQRLMHPPAGQGVPQRQPSPYQQHPPLQQRPPYSQQRPPHVQPHPQHPQPRTNSPLASPQGASYAHSGAPYGAAGPRPQYPQQMPAPHQQPPNGAGFYPQRPVGRPPTNGHHF